MCLITSFYWTFNYIEILKLFYNLRERFCLFEFIKIFLSDCMRHF